MRPSRPSLVRLLAGLFVLALSVALPARAQRQIETLGRGVVAQRTTLTEAYLSWRLLGTDPADVAFNVYRSLGGAPAVQLNAAPITATTDYRDSSLAEADFASTIAYHVRPVLGGVEQAPSAAFTLAANAPVGGQFLTIPLSTPTPNPASTNLYEVKFCWVGDLDGDGEYDFVVDRLSKVEGERQYLEAYKRDGTFLWRMDLGPNSLNQYAYEPGSSAISVGDTDNVTVFDMDGDGRAEVLVRTANGVTVAQAGGTQVAAITAANDTDQFVSVFNGQTGAELARLALPNPWAQFGTLTNKCAIAFLDGSRPSVIFYGYNRDGNGPFYRAFSAFDYRGGVLSLRWTLAQDQSVLPGSEGHQIRIADVDNDGRDEICDIGHVIDDDGTQLFHTPLTHGDRFHIADLNPDWPGYETYAIQQYNPTQLATAYYSSDTGTMFKKWYAPTTVDVGRGIALDLTAAHYGYEMYSTQPGIWNAQGDRIYQNNLWAPEGLWWDGDLAREFIDGAGNGAYNPAINKFNPATGAADRIYTMYNDYTGNFVIRQAYGGRPAFWGDILGDWREEVVVFTSDCSAIRIYNTNLSATNRLYTLMHNPAYRTQTTTKGYVQASYVDYYLGYGMFAPPPPPLSTAQRFWVGGAGIANTWDAGTTAAWRAGFAGATGTTFADGEAVLFDHTGANGSPVLLSGALAPASVSVYSANHFTFDGTAGSLGGAMTLTKQGSGNLTLTGAHGYTGATTVWDGALRVDGSLGASPVTVWGGTFGGALAGGETGGRLAGSGAVAAPVVLKYRGTLTPGAGMGSVGTLQLGGGLATEAGSTLAFDLTDDATGLTKPSDKLQVTGDVAIGGATTIFVRKLDATLPPGTYTLATYTGTLTGVANLSVAGLEGVPHTLSTSGGAITLTVPTVRAADAVVWAGGAGAQWDLATTAAWTLGGSPASFVPGDAVTFDAAGAGTPTVTLTEPVNPASITVAADTDYTFTGTGAIVGATGLTKTGTGTLTITGNHTFTGPVSIQGGAVAVAELNDGGVASSLGAAPAAAGNLVLANGAALRVSGTDSTSTNREITLGTGGGALDVTVSGVTLQLGGNVGGAGALTKSGAGGIILAAPNTYTGGTTIAGGLVALASDDANVSGLGTGGVTFLGGTLQMFDNINANSAATSAWPIHVPAGGAGTLRLDGRCNLTGALTGAGDFTLYTSYVRSELYGDWTAFTGRVLSTADADGGDLRLRHAGGLPLAELGVGARVYANYLTTLAADTTIPLGALSGEAGGWLAGGPTSGRTLTWSIGGKGVDTTFAGAIQNGTGPTAIAKVGAGTQTFSGANTYTGATTVTAGTLLINGTSSASAFTVQSGGTLGGTGTITGNVTLASGARLLAGAAPLNVVGTVTGSGTVGVTATGLRPDGTYHVVVATTLAGAPTWSYVGPLAAGQTATFTTIGGSLYVTLGTPGTPRSATAITWTGATSGFWDLFGPNWKLDADGTPTTFTAGDSLTFDDSLAGNPAIALVFAATPASVTFNNATTAYTLAAGAGGISGAATLTKNGAGSVVLSGGNSYTGATTVNAGTLLVNGTSTGSSVTVNSGATFGGSGALTGAVTFASGAKLRALTTGPLTVSGTVNVSGALAVTSPTTLTDGVYTLLSATTISGSATWTYDGPLSLNQVPTITVTGTTVTVSLVSHTPQPIVWTAAGGTTWNATAVSWKLLADGTPTTFIAGDSPIFNDTLAGAQTVTLPGSVSPATVTFANNTATYTLNATSPGIAGAANVVKSGTGNVTMGGTNTYTGTTTISAGTLTISAVGALGSGTVVLNGGTWATGALAPANAIQVDAPSTISGGNAGGTHGVRAITGASTLTLNATTGVFDLEGAMTGFTGTVVFTGGGGFRLFGTAGSSAADFDLTTRNVSARSGGAIALGSITGTTTAVLGVATNTTVYSIGGNNKSTTFPGVITNPAATYRASLTKVGTGTLTLTGANTYTGTTIVDAGTLVIAGAQNHGNNTNGTGAVTVNAGTLEITGSLTNVTTVEVKSGATLKLTGALTTGTLTIRAGGKLVGGGTINGAVVNEGLVEATDAATFTINGNLTNAATGVIRLKRGANLAHTGTFTNNGVYDVITAGTRPTPSAGTGTVLDAAVVVTSAFNYTTGGVADLTVTTHAGHSYQLQRKTDLLAATWDNVGAAVEGTGSPLVLTDATPPAGDKAFYRVIVDQ